MADRAVGEEGAEPHEFTGFNQVNRLSVAVGIVACAVTLDIAGAQSSPQLNYVSGCGEVRPIHLPDRRDGEVQYVEAEPRVLTLNDRITYTDDGVMSDSRKVDAGDIPGLRSGLLKLNGMSLKGLIQELNRYTAKKILIADSRLEKAPIRLGGIIALHDITSVLAQLKLVEPIAVRETDKAYILTYTEDSSRLHVPKPL